MFFILVYFPGGQPINILSRGPAQVPASTGPQGPNQPPVAMPNIPPPHQIPQQPISKKTNRKHALRIIDPSTGYFQKIFIPLSFSPCFFTLSARSDQKPGQSMLQCGHSPWRCAR